jgi:hypothetical protein
MALNNQTAAFHPNAFMQALALCEHDHQLKMLCDRYEENKLRVAPDEQERCEKAIERTRAVVDFKNKERAAAGVAGA